MKDKRTARRINLAYYLQVRNITNKRIIGRVGDISDKGMMILSERQLPQDAYCDVEISLPQSNSQNQKAVAMQIKAKWHKKDFNPNYYCIGCEFHEKSSNSELIIEHIIRNFAYSWALE